MFKEGDRVKLSPYGLERHKGSERLSSEAMGVIREVYLNQSGYVDHLLVDWSFASLRHFPDFLMLVRITTEQIKTLKEDV